MGDRRTQSQQSFDSFIINTGGASSGSSRSGGRSFGGSSRGSSSYSSGRSDDRGGDQGGYSSDRGGDRGGRSYGDRGGRSYGGDRGGRSFGGGGRGGNRRGGRGQDINESLYVRKASDVTIKEYESKHTFNDFEIHPALKERIERRGYKIPTAIQDQAIPLVLQGKDIIGLANITARFDVKA